MDDMLDQGTYHFIGFIYLWLAFVAFVLNSLVLFTFFKDRSLLVPSNLFILSISVADWLMAIVANPLGVASNVSKSWSLGSSSCVFYGFLTTTLGFGVMIHHSAIAIERCITLTKPFMVLRSKTVGAVIAFLWSFSIAWGAFPVFGWSAYVPEIGRMSCSIRWQSSGVVDASYIFAIFALFYFAPIVIFATTYSLTNRSLNDMLQNAIRLWGENALQTIASVKSKARANKMALVSATAFLIGWTPYAIVSLYNTTGDSEKLPPFLVVVPSLFAKTTTCYNPVIYFFMYSRFRASLLKSVRRPSRRNIVSPAFAVSCNFLRRTDVLLARKTNLKQN